MYVRRVGRCVGNGRSLLYVTLFDENADRVRTTPRGRRGLAVSSSGITVVNAVAVKGHKNIHLREAPNAPPARPHPQGRLASGP